MEADQREGFGQDRVVALGLRQIAVKLEKR